MVSIFLVGNAEPQTGAVFDELCRLGRMPAHFVDTEELRRSVYSRPDLLIVAGWRHLIPREVLDLVPTVGFHSAKLPEYPGRAPVPWTLLRGDRLAWNTMLYLDEGVDSGDLIDQRARVVLDDDTPETLYAWMAKSCVDMLRQHLPALLAGTAPRTPQDPALRGPLTTADGWQRWQALQS